MKIETKYDVGQHVIYAYLNEKTMEIELFDDYIGWISISEYNPQEVEYGLRDSCNDCKEEEIVLYEDNMGLILRIQNLFKKMHEMEDKNEKS